MPGTPFIVLAVVFGLALSIGVGILWSKYREQRKAEIARQVAEFDDLDRAGRLITRIQRDRAILAEMKASASRNELDGGWAAAQQHPIYLKAQKDLEAAQDELWLLS